MLQTGPPSNKEQEMKQAIEEIGGSVVNTILKNEVRYSIALLDIKTPSHICSK